MFRQSVRTCGWLFVRVVRESGHGPVVVCKGWQPIERGRQLVSRSGRWQAGPRVRISRSVLFHLAGWGSSGTGFAWSLMENNRGRANRHAATRCVPILDPGNDDANAIRSLEGAVLAPGGWGGARNSDFVPFLYWNSDLPSRKSCTKMS